MLKKISSLIKKSPPPSSIRDFQYFELGFHGDKYLLQFVDLLLQDCNYFVESGTEVGSTLAYVAQTYPNIQCISCEPDKQACEEAIKNTSKFTNVLIYNETSQDFIKIVRNHKKELFEENVLFWLDAHGYGFKWPLKEEVNFITTNFKHGYMLIDDFKVPGLECFRYDEYDKQICSFDYIKGSINKKLKFSVYYPSYTKNTSKYHPLVGWGLIDFGHELNTLEIPQQLKNKFQKAF